MTAPRHRVFAVPASILTILTLTGCATPAAYAPRGPDQATGYTDRQLHQHGGQFRVAQGGEGQFRALAEDPDPGQHGQLARQGANSDQNAAERKLQGEGNTVHGESSGPQDFIQRNCGIFRV